MYVRIARFEGGDPAEADQTVARVRQRMQTERPPGLEGAKRLLLLIDRQNGRGMGLTFFDSEEDLRRGDEALNAMTPEGGAQRASVEIYEVGMDEQF
jgi:hypothetical protein